MQTVAMENAVEMRKLSTKFTIKILPKNLNNKNAGYKWNEMMRFSKESQVFCSTFHLDKEAIPFLINNTACNPPSEGVFGGWLNCIVVHFDD